MNESQRPVERFANWIDSLPSWAQPTVYGACFILLLMGFRGAAFVLPVLILVVLIASDTPALAGDRDGGLRTGDRPPVLS